MTDIHWVYVTYFCLFLSGLCLGYAVGATYTAFVYDRAILRVFGVAGLFDMAAHRAGDKK